MKRRDFIKNTSLGLGAVGNLDLGKMNLTAIDSLYKVDADNDNILVIIQLFGGNDGMNTVIPSEWDDYYVRFRYRLHVPKNISIPFGPPEKGDAMHPNLAKGLNGGIYGIWKTGKLAVLNGVGHPNPNLSHFRSTDIWFSGIVPNNDGQPLNNGWLGRFFDKFGENPLPESPYCIHVGQSPLLLFQGEQTEKAILVEDPNQLYEQGKSVESEKIDLGENTLFSKEFDYINDIGVRINHFSGNVKAAFDKGKNLSTYDNSDLSNQLKLVARLIDGGLKTKVYSVSLNGFDTHASQGVVDGDHGKLLATLSSAVASFQDDIEKLGQSGRVLGITLSEFGRRPYENASQGTDHGSANVMFAFGDGVRNETFGDNLAFLPFIDSENLSFRYDFRSVYQEILRTWFGASASFTSNVLGGKYAWIEKKGFLKNTEVDNTLPPPPAVPVLNNDPKSPDNPNSPYNVTEQDQFSVFPNPTPDGNVVLNMVIYVDAGVTVTQLDVKGINYGVLLNKEYRKGYYVANLKLNGGHGLYVLHIKAANRNHYLKVIKL